MKFIINGATSEGVEEARYPKFDSLQIIEDLHMHYTIRRFDYYDHPLGLILLLSSEAS